MYTYTHLIKAASHASAMLRFGIIVWMHNGQRCRVCVQIYFNLNSRSLSWLPCSHFFSSFKIQFPYL